MLDAYNKIDKLQTVDNIEEMHDIKEILVEEIQKDTINKRLTLNLFKSILSKGYFDNKVF